MQSFVVCQQQQLRTRVSPYWVATNSFGAFSWVATQWLFTTVSMANPCSWLFLLGPAPFAVCFASLLDGETHIWLGDLRFAFCVVVFVICFVFDLPCYMTTGVNVDFISNCFFTCKDRALERDRPYQGEKKGPKGPQIWTETQTRTCRDDLHSAVCWASGFNATNQQLQPKKEGKLGRAKFLKQRAWIDSQIKHSQDMFYLQKIHSQVSCMGKSTARLLQYL